MTLLILWFVGAAIAILAPLPMKAFGLGIVTAVMAICAVRYHIGSRARRAKQNTKASFDARPDGRRVDL